MIDQLAPLQNRVSRLHAATQPEQIGLARIIDQVDIEPG
jgi:hypothetical protein